jgi:hypothetical protein
MPDPILTLTPGRALAMAFAASLDATDPPAGRYVTDLAAAEANDARVRREKAAQLRAFRRLLADPRPKSRPKPRRKSQRKSRRRWEPSIDAGRAAAIVKRYRDGETLTAICHAEGLSYSVVQRVVANGTTPAERQHRKNKLKRQAAAA